MKLNRLAFIIHVICRGPVRQGRCFGFEILPLGKFSFGYFPWKKKMGHSSKLRTTNNNLIKNPWNSVKVAGHTKWHVECN